MIAEQACSFALDAAIISAGLPDGQPLASCGATQAGGRKVRSPQGNMPANGRGGPLKADFTESATENYTAGQATVR
jgi:hypothetical protein